jgi:uncharacterized membrane protein
LTFLLYLKSRNKILMWKMSSLCKKESYILIKDRRLTLREICTNLVTLTLIFLVTSFSNVLLCSKPLHLSTSQCTVLCSIQCINYWF